MDKRVLIISHGVISKTTNSGKTLYSLFNQWERDKIAQLYINPEVPDNDLCSNFYRVSDRDVFKSIFKRKKQIGKVLTQSDINFDIASNRETSEKEEKIHVYARKRRPYMYILRNFLWSLGKWNNKQLKEWLDEFNPEVIFYMAGSFTFSYDIAIKISEMLDIPLVPYFSDDHYINNPFSRTPLGLIVRSLFKKKAMEIVEKSQTYFCINEKMALEYERVFGKKSNVIMTPFTKQPENVLSNSKSELKKIVYAGNLNFNRHKTLIELSKVLTELNNKSEYTKYELYVYSGIKDKKIITQIENTKMKFMGKVNQQELEEVYNEADYLLHVESFDKKSINKTMYSTSTKIPDLLVSNKPIIIIGPKNIASVEYILNHNAGYVITNGKFTSKLLLDIFSSEDVQTKLNNARTTALLNHSSDNNSMILKEALNVNKEI